jgi:uncharacterized DUF497 family protein
VVYNLVWTDSAREHISKHGILESEVEAVVWGRHNLRKGRGRSLLLGRFAERFLLVVLEKSANIRGAFEIITAREAKSSEKHLLLRRGKGV